MEEREAGVGKAGVGGRGEKHEEEGERAVLGGGNTVHGECGQTCCVAASRNVPNLVNFFIKLAGE